MIAPLMVALSVGLAALAVGLGIYWWLTVRQAQEVRRRMTTEVLAKEAATAGDRWWQLFSGPGRKMDAWFDESGETERLLVQAGWRSTVERAAYFAAQALLPLATVGLVVLATLLGKLEGAAGFIYGLAAACAGLLAPRFYLRRRAAGRQMLIRSEVGMFIHLLALLFDAGLSLRQALVSLVREGAHVLPALGDEIRVVLRQLEAGADPAEALHGMGRSLDVDELNTVLGVLRQVDRYGGELREPLMEALAVVEERRQLALREKVNVLSGRMTVVMVLFFFPALLIFVAGPAFLSIIQALG